MRKIYISVCSDVGKSRENNEDNFVVNSHYNDKSVDFFEQDYRRAIPVIAGVFDGMGGTQNGEIASLLCARESIQLRQLISDCDDEEITLRKFYSHLNRILLRRQVSSKTEFGTTACIVVVLKTKVVFSNVGDSAIFLIRDGEICKKSVDDNQVQLLLDINAITKEEAANHPMKNMLTQYMGMGLSQDSFEPEPHIEIFERAKGSRYTIVICSDGICGVLSEKQIKEISEKEECCASELVDAALNSGTKDNATAIIIKIN